MVDKTYEHEPVEEFVFEDWLRDGVKGFRSKFKEGMKGEGRGRPFDTSEFREHLRNARKEQLLAIRSLVDSAIDWLDKKEAEGKNKA